VTPPTDRPVSTGAEDPRIRRSWLVFATAFVALGAISALRLVAGGGRPVDVAITGLIVVVGFAAISHRRAAQRLEDGRRAEAESFARILQGLSRSISPDAIVGAIVEELGAGTGADHVVIVRRRPESPVLEATLVNARTGGSTSSTLFPISDLDEAPAPISRVAPPPRIAVPVGASEALVAPVGAAASSRLRARSTRPAARATTPFARPAAVAAAESDRGPVTTVDRSGRPAPATTVRSFVRSDSERLRDRDGRDGNALVAEQIAARARSVFGLRHTLVAPLSAEGGRIGALVISRRTPGSWPEAAQRVLNGAAIEASAALARAYSHREAEARASTDALTGLPNRRYFDEFCALLARRRRAEDSVGVLMIDIDRFKSVNDAHGHAVGDEVLRGVASSIAGAVREDDVPARYGGEEFAVLLRNPSRAVAVEVGERVRRAVGGLHLDAYGVESVSVSVGTAIAERADEPIVDIVGRADRALYAAKRQGRDRVVAG
jgi:diguanylate cyclase (GGDEF)-like protein